MHKPAAAVVVRLLLPRLFAAAVAAVVLHNRAIEFDIGIAVVVVVVGQRHLLAGSIGFAQIAPSPLSAPASSFGDK